MLEELEQYENLGTPGYFWELLNNLKTDGSRWTVRDVRDHFYNRIVDGESVFDGCLPLAIAVGVVSVNESEEVSLADFANDLMSERHMRGKMLEHMFLAMQEDTVFGDIFSPANISYDVVYNVVQVENAAFGFKHANFRKLLIGFGFLSDHPDSHIRRLIVSPRYRALFDRCVLPGIKRKKIGIESLHEMLAQRQVQGSEAEDFVVEFERRRLAAHPKPESVQRISDYDVAAGYDIVSYETYTSAELDRFIEVKSCSTNRRFYWSKNEVSQARIRRNRYFLYLVDPAKIKNTGYEPEIIQDPYQNVFMDESWSREAQTWLFSKE